MSMTDAEIREALARAERATPGPWYSDCMYSGPKGRRFGVSNGDPKWRGVLPEHDAEFCVSARTDVPRLAADLLAARVERDEARAAHESERRVYGEDVRINAARAEAAEARCRELEGFVRGFLHASSGTRNENAAALLSRLETRAQVLLSPPSPHTCQIHRATSGASDCGLEPCEEATVHRDRGEARPAENATPEAVKCATCGHEERRHLSEDGDGARWCDVALCDCVDYAALEVNRG